MEFLKKIFPGIPPRLSSRRIPSKLYGYSTKVHPRISLSFLMNSLTHSTRHSSRNLSKDSTRFSHRESIEIFVMNFI